MASGKQTCRILKEIRRQIAEANEIEFVTSVCRFKGECLGTCPKCEEEVQYLEKQLRSRQLMGKVINLAGISVGALSLLSPFGVQSQTPVDAIPTDAITDSLIFKGAVFAQDTLTDGTISRAPLPFAVIKNLQNQEMVTTDMDGTFQIKATPGDNLRINYIGYETIEIPVTTEMRNEEIVMPYDNLVLGEIVAINPDKLKNIFKLRIIDEHNQPISPSDCYVERIYLDENGEEDSYDVSLITDNNEFIIQWDTDPALQDETGNPLKEAILRIEVEGYATPKIIKVKYPKRVSKKTVRFKHVVKISN
jgi:hypothetical protein